MGAREDALATPSGRARRALQADAYAREVERSRLWWAVAFVVAGVSTIAGAVVGLVVAKGG